MIKSLLLGVSALALTSGVAMAQTVDGQGDRTTAGVAAASAPTRTTELSDLSRIEQDGNNNEADVDQRGAGLNASEIDQTAPTAAATPTPSNSATVDQRAAAGGENNSSITQLSTNRAAPFPPSGPGTRPSAGRQIAVVDQTAKAGDANNAVIVQGVSGAPGTQTRADITQTGSGNDAAIQQGGNSAPNDYDGNLFSSIEQTGDDNVAENLQGESDFSTIDQTGTANRAFVRQTADTGDRNRISTVVQDGENNLADVDQTDMFSDSDVNQTGRDNDAFVTQNDGATSDVNQGMGMSTGSFAGASVGNSADVNQNAGSAGAESTVNQDGRFNEATVNQSDDATSDISQNGIRNIATVSQLSGSEDAESTITQIGRGNDATVTQSADATSEISQGTGGGEEGAFSGENFNNRAFVSQELGSDGSESVIFQDGEDNLARVTQSTEDSFSRIDQFGFSNFAVVRQVGSDGANSDINQNGTGNIARVRQ